MTAKKEILNMLDTAVRWLEALEEETYISDEQGHKHLVKFIKDANKFMQVTKKELKQAGELC